MAGVFISYAREDKDFVQKLQDTFTAQNRETWVDLDDLYAGEEFWPRICIAIEEAEAFLFVISPEALSSAYCQQELAYAVEHHKRIVPIYYREVDEKTIPQPLAARQWQFFRATDDFPAPLRHSWRSSTSTRSGCIPIHAG